MGKMSELALLLDEFRKANRRANELAEEISAMLSGEEPHPHEKAKEVKPLTLEEVRAVLADKSRNGYTEQIRELLKKHGADRILFATDSPWSGMREDIEIIRSFGLDKETEQKIFCDNAKALLGI